MIGYSLVMRVVQRLGWLGITLFVSRVLAELGALSPVAVAPVTFGLAGLGLGFALGMTLHERGVALWPGVLLWGYVVYPHFNPRLSAVIGLWALGIWFVAIAHLPRDWRLDVATFLATLGLYLATLSPGLLPADAGELQLVASRLGIAHPPGFPLYTILGWLFTLLTPANPTLGLNLFSAVTMAATVAIIERTARRATDNAWAGLVAGLTFAVATSVWATGTQASIRPLTALFTALSLHALLAFRAQGEQRHLSLLGLALGAGIAHHVSLAFLAPIIGLALIAFEPGLLRTPRRWIALLGTGVAGFIPWLYLPLRAAMDAPSAPSSLTTWAGFWDYVLGRGFAGDFFYFHTLPALADRAEVLGNVLLFQWSGVLLVLVVLAALSLALRDWRTLLAIGGVFCINAFVSMTYRAPQTVEYLMPGYVALAVALGTGLGWIGEEKLRALALSATLVAGLAVGARHLPSFAALARDHSSHTYAEIVLQQAPPGAVVLANWHWATPLQVLQTLEGVRPDVEVVYVYPEGAEPLAETWARRITEEIRARPVVVTGFYPDTYATLPVVFEPLPDIPAWHARATPRRDIPPEMTPLDIHFENGLTLAGVDVSRSELPTGETFPLRLAWRVEGQLSPGLVGFVHLVDAEGHVLNGDDRPLPSALASVGDVLITRHTLGAPPTLAPGTYEVFAGLYIVGPDGEWTTFLAGGQERVPVGTITVSAPTFPAPTTHPIATYFAGGWILRGFDWDTSLDVPRLVLHWQAYRSTTVPAVATVNGDSFGALSLPVVSVQGEPASSPPHVGLLDANGQPLLRLGPWGVPLRGDLRLRGPEGGARYVHLGGSMVLSEFRVHPADELRPSDELRIDLTLLGTQPLLEDYVIKVDLIGQGWAWRAQSDHIPATGALPTLKWILGTRVVDCHRLTVPADAPPTTARAELIVYNHFTGERLPILDPDLVERGIAVQLDDWVILPP